MELLKLIKMIICCQSDKNHVSVYFTFSAAVYCIGQLKLSFKHRISFLCFKEISVGHYIVVYSRERREKFPAHLSKEKI